jgi:hypothetical protein
MLIGKQQPSEAERFDALVSEIKSGIELQKHGEQAREWVAADEAKQYRGKQQRNAVTANMRHVAELPAAEYFNLCRKYGHDEVHSKGFIKYLQKHYPHLATAAV